MAWNTVWPDQGAAVVVFVNLDGTDAPRSITDQIASLLLTEAEDSQAEQASQQARQIFDGLLEGKIDRSLLTPNADAYFTRQVLEDASASLKALGPPEFLKQTSVLLRGGMTCRYFEITFQRQVPTPEHAHSTGRQVGAVPDSVASVDFSLDGLSTNPEALVSIVVTSPFHSSTARSCARAPSTLVTSARK